MLLRHIVNYHVFAGTVWWDKVATQLRQQFKHMRPLTLDDVSQFQKEVLGGTRHLVVIFDDNGELVWDLILIQQLLERNPDLAVTGIVNANVIENNSNHLTLDVCLRHEKLKPLASQLTRNGRFRILAEYDPRFSIDVGFCTAPVHRVLETADIVLVKGVAAFTTMQQLNSPTYYSFVVHSAASITCTGLQKGAGVFIRVPPSARAYLYGEKTLSELRASWT